MSATFGAVGGDLWRLSAACGMANNIGGDDVRESVAMAVEECRDERGVDCRPGHGVGDVDPATQLSRSRLPDRRSSSPPGTPSSRRCSPAA